MSRFIIRQINSQNNFLTQANGKLFTLNANGILNAFYNRKYSISTDNLKRKRTISNQVRYVSSSGIIKSPLGPCPKIPNENLVEYVFKKMDDWSDEPAAVSTLIIILIVT